MKLFDFALDKLGGISKAITRFLAVFLCLLATAVLIAISIETDHNFMKVIMTLAFGVFCFLAAQSMAERFGNYLLLKLAYYLAALLVMGAYYVYIRSVDSIDAIVYIKTLVAAFSLFIAFIWVPSIRKPLDFCSAFLSVFKSLITSAFFSGIIFGGLAAIIGAIDALLFNIDEKIYMHITNIIWVVWAPMLFLSLVPVFTGRREQAERVRKSIGYPKFLEVLLSYVLIPLISIYTIVLLVYMGKTFFIGDWNNNLLEPLILTYLIGVLVIYILVKGLGNVFVRFFRRVFPLLLTVIALFQIVASLITVSHDGIVYTRYFVILFSLYAVICGVILSIFPRKKSGFIAWLAVIFALVGISPFIGAFSVSAASQSAIVENTLEKNDMLQSGAVVPNNNLSEEDKDKISSGIEYLNSIGEIEKLAYLPDGFDLYSDFSKVFGFDLYDIPNSPSYTYKEYSLDPALPINVMEYNYLLATSVHISDGKANEEGAGITINGEDYIARLVVNDESDTIVFYRDDVEIMTIPLENMFNILADYPDSSGTLSSEKLTFNYENNVVKARIVIRSAYIYFDETDVNLSADIYILYSLK